MGLASSLCRTGRRVWYADRGRVPGQGCRKPDPCPSGRAGARHYDAAPAAPTVPAVTHGRVRSLCGVRFPADSRDGNTSGYRRGAARRGDQIERVAAAVKAFAAVEDALIVAGDFNETPGGVVWRRLSALGLTDVGAADPAPTFSVGSPRRRIDAIFCSASLVSKNYRVWRAGGVAAASDHFPIVAEFGAPRRDSCP